MVLAAGLMSVAAWLLVSPWRDDRVVRLAAPAPDSDEFDESVGDVLTRWRHRLSIGPVRRRAAARERVRVLQALGALAAELDAGQPPGVALLASAGTPPVWPRAVGAAVVGDDIAAALRADAHSHEVLGQLAVCWQVAVDSGAGLAAAVGTLTASSRAAEDVRVQLEAELAGPRATARTLALLPLVGIGFGTMLGGDPFGWLVGTGPGRMCLLTGLALTVLGAWWTARIAKAVERRL